MCLVPISTPLCGRFVELFQMSLKGKPIYRALLGNSTNRTKSWIPIKSPVSQSQRIFRKQTPKTTYRNPNLIAQVWHGPCEVFRTKNHVIDLSQPSEESKRCKPGMLQKALVFCIFVSLFAGLWASLEYCVSDMVFFSGFSIKYGGRVWRGARGLRVCEKTNNVAKSSAIRLSPEYMQKTTFAKPK